MKLPRHAELWGPAYIHDRWARLKSNLRPRRVWLMVADHYEPFWGHSSTDVAEERVQRWADLWPQLASEYTDSAGNPLCYTFFYPEEEYHAEFLDKLSAMREAGIADVEVHIHHDRDSRAAFIDRMGHFCEVLHHRHGLLRTVNGKLSFGFIHGNWALDNSLPGGQWCGLNDEITILRDLGCYADFTMPSGNSASQARTINTIYWAKDDPQRPKSYDYGVPLTIGGGREGDLLMIPGPLGLRWAERLVPRMEIGEISASDSPTPYRILRWLQLAPQVGSDIFIKLHTHGAQEQNSAALLGGGLQRLFSDFAEQCHRQNCSFFFVSAWQMYLALEALRECRDPIQATAHGRCELPCSGSQS